MEILATAEKEMLSVFQDFIRNTDEHDGVDDIRRYIDLIKVEDVYATIGGFMENPINAFHFVKRMHDKWGNIISKLECDDCLDHQTAPVREFHQRILQIDERYAGNIRVTSSDLRHAALAMVRLWQTYNLDLTAFISGRILDEITSPLSLEEVFYICNLLHDDDDLYDVIQWLEALQKYMQQSEDLFSENELTQVARRLASTYAKVGMPWVSEEILGKALVGKGDANMQKLERDIKYYRQKVNDLPASERYNRLRSPDTDSDKVHYEALCRGDIRRDKKVMSKLRCIYRPTKIPYSRVKEEIINYSPRLSMFYEVISDEEIGYIQDLAHAKLAESLITGNVQGGRTDYSYRISQTAWFRNFDDPIFETISRRVELITGLSTKQEPLPFDGEDLQVLNYGVGGMYRPHEDYFGFPIHIEPNPPDTIVELINSGDREATWMFYMSDVKAGGATVFTRLNITVPPVKNAAVFWFDITRNGELDPRTTHAGCPVLLGSKWVANKWIRQSGQMFRRPCGPHENSIDVPLHS